MQRALRLPAAMGLLCLIPAIGLASPVLYLSPTDPGWTSAISGLTPGSTIDFSSLTSNTTYFPPAWPVIGGVTFGAGADPGYNNFRVSPSGVPEFNWGTGNLLVGPATWAHGFISMLLPGDVMAIQFFVGVGAASSGTGGDVLVTINGTDSRTITTATQSSGLTFVGFTSSVPITSVWVGPASPAGYAAILDNVTFYQTTSGSGGGGGSGSGSGGGDPPVSAENPELDTWILAVTGLVLLYASARSHRRVRVRADRSAG